MPSTPLISAAASSSRAPYPSPARELKSAQPQTHSQCFYPLGPASADPVCHPDEFLLCHLGQNPVPTQPHPISVLLCWLQCHSSATLSHPWRALVCVWSTQCARSCVPSSRLRWGRTLPEVSQCLWTHGGIQRQLSQMPVALMGCWRMQHSPQCVPVHMCLQQGQLGQQGMASLQSSNAPHRIVFPRPGLSQ